MCRVKIWQRYGLELATGNDLLRVMQVLNQIVYELPTEHPLADSRPLREYLGHTPVQVNSNRSPY